MIQPLRLAHRRAFSVLAVVLPVIFFAGIETRHTQSAAPSTPMPAPGTLVKASEGLWRSHTIRTELYRDTQHVYVILRPTEELAQPDLLLYWVASIPEQAVLPAQAQLLGPFKPGKTFVLSSDDNTGGLVLFSLAHQSIVDTARLEKTP